MKPTERFIFELGRAKNPLGRPIQPEEVPGLVEGLCARLGTSSQELDLTPKSLKTLELKLVKFKEILDQEGQSLSEEELAVFIRQIAAYLGEVFVIHAKGYWDKRMISLSNSGVAFEGEWEYIKDGELRSSQGMVVVIGWWAARVWDEIILGEKNGRCQLA